MKPWTYFLGGTIITPDVVSVVQKYENSVRAMYDKEIVRSDERHLTIIPPFRASYEIASYINIGCMASTLFSNHPLTKTCFVMKGLTIMTFEGFDILCFPVISCTKGEGCDDFVTYVQALRQKLLSLGIQYREKIPEEYRPHITIFIGKNIRSNKDVQSLIKKSKQEEAITFRLGYPTLYTKTKDGWGDLSNDPSLTKE